MRKLIGMVIALAALPGMARAQEKRPESPQDEGPSREELRWRVPAMGRMRFQGPRMMGRGMMGPMQFRMRTGMGREMFRGPRFREPMFHEPMFRGRMFRMHEGMAFRGGDFRMPRMNMRVPRMHVRVPRMDFDGPMHFRVPRMDIRVPRMHIRTPDMRMRMAPMHWREDRDGDEEPAAGPEEGARLRSDMMALRGGMLRMKHSRYRPV